jgi:NitT/TauT family transport system permease protein
MMINSNKKDKFPQFLTKKRLNKLSKKYIAIFWKIRDDIPIGLYYSMVSLSIIVPLLIWSILTYGGYIDPLFMPNPMAVLQSGYNLFHNGNLMSDVFASLFRITWGFLISACISVPLGLLIGTFKSIQGLLEPILGWLRYMPTAAFIPLVIVWIGLNEPAKISIIFLGSFFYNALMIADAVKFIPIDLIKAAYTLGATKKDVFFDVIFPATLPNIIDTLRINIATAWNFVVVAELVASNSGLGYRILLAQRFLRIDEIFVGIIIIGLIGLGMDFLFKLIFRLAVPWAVEKT